MKKIMMLMFAAILVAGIPDLKAQTSASTQTSATAAAYGSAASAASQKIASQWMNALNRQDTFALASLYADSAILLSPNWEGARVGQAAVREIYHRYFAGTPDLFFLLTHLIATDSALVIEYLSGGTFQNPESSSPAYMKGKKYRLQNCTRLDIRDGKIQRQINYFDQVAFLRQVGFFDQR